MGPCECELVTAITDGEGVDHLRDNVFVLFIFKNRFRWQVQRQHHEPDDIRLDLCGLLKTQSVRCICSRSDRLGFNLKSPLKDLLDNGCARLRFGATEREMQVVEEPGEEVDRVGLIGEREAFRGAEGDFLKQLVRGDVRFEGMGIPDLADEDGESLCKFWPLREVFEHEVVSEWGYMGECVYHYI